MSEALVVNHSWIAGWYQDGIYEGMDWLVCQGQMQVAGLNNYSSVPVLACNFYNGIAVGVSSLRHSKGDTIINGVGRQIPHVVEPETYTSYATPVTSKVCYNLMKKRLKCMQVKAAIMASARRPDEWTNSPDRPLDDEWGAGEVDQEAVEAVEFSHSVSHVGGAFCAALCWLKRDVFKPMSLYLFDEFGKLVAHSTSQIDSHQLIYLKDLKSGFYSIEADGDIPKEDYAVAWISG